MKPAIQRSLFLGAILLAAGVFGFGFLEEIADAAGLQIHDNWYLALIPLSAFFAGLFILHRAIRAYRHETRTAPPGLIAQAVGLGLALLAGYASQDATIRWFERTSQADDTTLVLFGAIALADGVALFRDQPQR